MCNEVTNFKNITEELYKSSFDIFIAQYHHLELSDNDFKELFVNLYKEFRENIDKRTKELFKKNKNKKLEHIAQQIFITEFEQKDEKNYLRYQILAGKMIIKKYCDEIIESEDFKINSITKSKITFINQMVIDLLGLLPYYEKKYLSKKPESSINRSQYIDGRKIFDISRQIKMEQFCKGDADFLAISIFSIRQAIEVMLRNTLGIDYVIEGKQIYKQLSGERLIKFFYKNDNIIMPQIEESLLLQIQKWTNLYIHGGILMYHWQIEIAHELLLPLFYGSGYEYGIRIKKSYIENRDIIEKELLEFMEINEGKIIWRKKVEAKLID